MPSKTFNLKIHAAFFGIAICIALTGCNDGSPDDNSTISESSSGGSSSAADSNTSEAEVSAFNISDANTLMIGPGEDGSEIKENSSSTEDALFKVTGDGYVEEVTVTDDDGNEKTITNTPTDIHKINQKYIAIGFDTRNYLVRKEDGAAFRLERAPDDLWGERFVSRGPYRTDDEGNIYFPAYNEENNTSIYKISAPESNDVTSERITPEKDQVFSFAISDEGAVAYTGDPQSRLVAPSGGLTNISNDSDAIWETPDGELRFNDDKNIKGASLNEDGSFSITTFGEFSTSVPFSLTYLLLEANNKLYVIEYRESNDELVRELPNREKDARLLTGLPLEKIKAADSSGSHLYLAGTTNKSEPQLIKLDPEEGSSQTLLSDRYDIYKLGVSSSGEITFSATRLKDGARVVGEVDGDGNNLRLLEEDLNEKISELIRVK